MGSGHFMRMLALTQLLTDSGFEVHLATIPYSEFVLDYFSEENIRIHTIPVKKEWSAEEDLGVLFRLVKEIGPSWIVLDGYHFDEDYEKSIKKLDIKLLRVDDIPKIEFSADVVLNQNYGAEKMKYQSKSNTQICTGLDYLLLRREFRHINFTEGNNRKQRPFHLLICLGGGTPVCHALNLLIVKGLAEIKNCNFTCTLIAGKIDEDSHQLTETMQNLNMQLEIKSHSPNMAMEMLEADGAIVAGGSTMWELMFMGVPFMAISLNNDQKDYLEFLTAEDLCFNLGYYDDLTPKMIGQRGGEFIQNQPLQKQFIRDYSHLFDRSNYGKKIMDLFDS